MLHCTICALLQCKCRKCSKCLLIVDPFACNIVCCHCTVCEIPVWQLQLLQWWRLELHSFFLYQSLSLSFFCFVSKIIPSFYAGRDVRVSSVIFLWRAFILVTLSLSLPAYFSSIFLSFHSLEAVFFLLSLSVGQNPFVCVCRGDILLFLCVWAILLFLCVYVCVSYTPFRVYV